MKFSMDVVSPYYDYGLGAVIHSKSERRQLMREKGLEEVGNEDLKFTAFRKKTEHEEAKEWEALKCEGMKYLANIDLSDDLR